MKKPAATLLSLTQPEPTNANFLRLVLMPACIDTTATRPNFEHPEPLEAGHVAGHVIKNEQGEGWTVTRYGAPGRGNTTSYADSPAEALATLQAWARKRFKVAPVAEHVAPAAAPEQPAPADPIVTPENQAIVTARALAGKLTDAQRKNLVWLGFEVPEYVVREDRPKWAPMPKPEPGAADLAALVAGSAGPATGAQVYELPGLHPMRRAYDETPRSDVRNYATIYAAGRSWRVAGNAWGRWAGMTDRQAANSSRRAKLEAERTEKKRAELNAQLHKSGPLTALFYGIPEAPKPRYTTAEEAQAHEMQRRQEGHDHHRQHRARDIRELRRELDCLPEAELARLYTDWQRSPGGYGLEYLADRLYQLVKKQCDAEGLGINESREEAWHRHKNPTPAPTSRAALFALQAKPTAEIVTPNANHKSTDEHSTTHPKFRGTKSARLPQPKQRHAFHPVPGPGCSPRAELQLIKRGFQGAGRRPAARAAAAPQECARLRRGHLHRGPTDRRTGRDLLPLQSRSFLPPG